MAAKKTREKFLLVGNAPFGNRGCEAIVRGTVEILDREFGSNSEYVNASFGNEIEIRDQSKRETNGRIVHLPIRPKSRLSLDYLVVGASRLLGHQRVRAQTIPTAANGATAALQIGGDNYSLDYGYPLKFLSLDGAVARLGVPNILWGASVGPFDADVAFERRMARHLRDFRLILARETRSYAYLRGLGLDNVAHVADPAFVMTAHPVVDVLLPEKFIGVNFSPLTAKRATNGDLGAWAKCCAEVVRHLLTLTGLPIVLVPHVSYAYADNDDDTFLARVHSLLASPDRVQVLRSGLTSAQLKWVIGKAQCFAGARTHATIAAISSAVPTLSFAYSVKAWGINEDIFGHHEFCVDVQELLDSQRVAERIAGLADRHDIRHELTQTLPRIRLAAHSAGRLVREALGIA